MLLAVDIGNTHMVLGLFHKKELLCDWRVQTSRGTTTDELATKLHGLLLIKNQHFQDITGVIIGSVVPPLDSVWCKLADKYLGCRPLLVRNKKINTGISILTDNPDEVGADRIINSVAGFSRYKKRVDYS